MIFKSFIFDTAFMLPLVCLQPSFCTEYIDNNAYDIHECPDSEYNMWDCCFIHLSPLARPDDETPGVETERTSSQQAYEKVSNTRRASTCVGLLFTEPQKRTQQMRPKRPPACLGSRNC